MSSREAILEAAVVEFIAHGQAGLRMEHVAARAGCNKALVYRWFTDKETLLRAALTRRFEERAALLDRLPATLAELLVWWTRATAADPDFMRMVLREALDLEAGPVVHRAFRRAYYRRQVELVRQLQKDGQITPSLDPTMLFLALLAIVTLPTSLPQIVELVAGRRATTRAFQADWEETLAGLARQLAPTTA